MPGAFLPRPVPGAFLRSQSAQRSWAGAAPAESAVQPLSVAWQHSLHVLGRVQGTVIVLVGDEGGQASELDVAQAAVPVLPLGTGAKAPWVGALQALV